MPRPPRMQSFEKKVETAGPRPGASEIRTRQHLEPIAASFAVTLESSERVAHAALSEVYVLEDPAGRRYVLRGQSAELENIARLARAARLADQVRPLLDVELPRFCESSGQKYAVQNGLSWPLFPCIEGEVVCSWRNCHKATNADIEAGARALRAAHRATQGAFHDDQRSFFIVDIKAKLSAIEETLSETVLARVRDAIENLEATISDLSRESLAFVHGDFHLGNVIMDGGRVRGFIDVDWSRIGHPFEDLALFAMMTMRDYTTRSYDNEGAVLERIKTAYGLAARETGLLSDYFILSVLHDVYVFKHMIVDPNAPYLDYQVRMLERSCAAD